MADEPRSAPDSSSPPDTLPNGLFAERYRIERILGRGGMATVYAVSR